MSFAGGYLAGILCAFISHPADNLVSFLNNTKGATSADVSRNCFINVLLLLIYHMLYYVVNNNNILYRP